MRAAIAVLMPLPMPIELRDAVGRGDDTARVVPRVRADDDRAGLVGQAGVSSASTEKYILSTSQWR